MLFNSCDFLIFLPLVFCLYWFLHRRLRAQNALIVVASYVFYGWWDWRFLILIAFTSLWAYLFGLLEKNPGSRSTAAKWRLAISFVINLGILGCFKYFNFFAEQAHMLLACIGLETSMPSLRIILPVGISFYTFQALSYTVDIYRGNIRPTKDPIAFFAFISFFPQLVAGPIERATNLLPQFLVPRKFDYADAVCGCRQMLWGFFKKMVFADNCAVVANELLNGPLDNNGLAVAIGVLMFTFQVYGDFSGYSDIAIGTSRLFGIRLMQNFAYPYFARDIAEFWRRWHISLTTWFRDYLYLPLGGSRCSKWKQIRNTYTVFLVSGLWHGANWTFVLWGLFHATLFLPLLLMKKNRRYLGPIADGRMLPDWHECLAVLRTFLLFALGCLIFRAQSATECVVWLKSVVNPLSWHIIQDVPREIWTALGSILFVHLLEWINRKNDFGFASQPRPTILRWLLYLVILALIVFYTPGGSTFIYFQF